MYCSSASLAKKVHDDCYAIHDSCLLVVFACRVLPGDTPKGEQDVDFVGICRVFSGAWTWPPMGSADMDTGADTQCLMHLVGGMALLKVCKWTIFRVNVAQICPWIVR